VVEQVTVQGSDGSGTIGTNGNNSLLIVVHNQGTATATQVSATITTTTPGVQIIQSQSTYNDIPQGQSQVNSIPLQISTQPGFVAGTPIDLTVTINSGPQSVTSNQRLYTGNSGVSLPNNDGSSAAPTSGSAIPQDLTPWDLGNLEPLWMADDASCLLKAAPGKYVLWRPGADPIPMVNPNFLAHRLTRQGVVVGELANDNITIDFFRDEFINTVGAQWIPGQPAPTPLTTSLYSYPKGSAVGQNVGLAYDVDPVTSQLNYLGGVGDYPKLNTVWDMNASGQSAGAASVYLRPPDLNGDGYISTNEVRAWSLEVSDYDSNGLLQGMQTDERTISAGYPGGAALQLYYNAFLTSATRFNPDTTWNWLGPVNFTAGSVFSVALLINDLGDVAGTGATHTGDPTIDPLNPTRVFRWNVGDGEFALGTPVVEQLGLLDGGQHAYPLAMNQAGDIVGYSDMNVLDPLPDQEIHAALWSVKNTAPQDLGNLGGVPGDSQAFAINDNRQIVGTSQKADGSSAAVLWQFNHNLNGVPFWENNDLNNTLSDTNWNVFNAVGINNNGLILAYATNYATGENHAVLLMQMAMAVDNNRDGQISFGQDDQTTPQNPYRFWINDSSESGDALSDGKNSIPGYGSPNYSRNSVNGRSDLVNFFPVALNLSNILQLLPPLSGLEYHLSQANSAFKFVYTDLTQSNTFDYLTDVTTTGGYGIAATKAPQSADTISVSPSSTAGTKLDNNWLTQVEKNGGVGIILVEGSMTTTSPLVMEIWNNGQKLLSAPLYLSIDGVEKMYRWVNLRHGVHAAENRHTDTSEPANYPDSLSNGKNFVFVHGYNVTEEKARGWNAEIFKRLYQSHSHAKFYAVDWQGSESYNSIFDITPNYHTNVANAFLTAPFLKDFLAGLSGETTLAGHSLGNMVCLSAINDWNAAPTRYFMIDAAVPMEAIDGSVDTDARMVHPDWSGIASGFWASKWFNVWPSDDARNALTWNNRFSNFGSTALYNFYSSGEEVLRADPNSPPAGLVTTFFSAALNYFSGHSGVYSWAWQEKLKGRMSFSGVVGSTHGGWGFNDNLDSGYVYFVNKLRTHIPPAVLINSVIQTNAFFDMSVDTSMFTADTSGNDYAKENRNRILSDAIPALTLPIGANAVSVIGATHNFNMQTEFEIGNNWPAERLASDEGNNWHHSDIRDVAYPFNYKVFDQIVKVGNLK
jgi:hypothetical protein